jgi:hypothetical protein
MPCSAPANLGVTHRQLDGQDGRYFDRDNEVIVGLQTDQPFKRVIFPFGGLRMVDAGLKAAGFEADLQVCETFTKYRKTHNDGVFDAYAPEIMQCRKSGIITGLPDAYGRGRIIGDYRRVALYGADRLLNAKRAGRAKPTPCGRARMLAAHEKSWRSKCARPQRPARDGLAASVLIEGTIGLRRLPLFRPSASAGFALTLVKTSVYGCELAKLSDPIRSVF